MHRLKAAFYRTRSQRREGTYRSGYALEVPCPKVVKYKKMTKKSSRDLGNDDHVRLSEPLQARREVRRLADNAALLRFTRSDQITDNN